MSEQIYDVVIIGGGLSGLAAAVKLTESGKTIALIEQLPRLGGRCYSFVDKSTGDVVDNGQHLLVGAYHNLLEYLNLIGSRHLVSSKASSELLFFHPKKGSGKFSLSSLPKPLNLLKGLLNYKHLKFSERLELIKVGMVLIRLNESNAVELKSLTVYQWLDQLGQSDEAIKNFWNPVAVSIMNESTNVASAFLFARALKATFLGSRYDSAILTPVVGQSDLYSEPVLKFLEQNSAKIFLNYEVIGLEMGNDLVKKVNLKNGESLKARSTICAVPHYALSSILPVEIRAEKPFNNLDRIGTSSIVSINLWFEENFMKVDSIGLIDRKIHWIFNRRQIIPTNKKTGYISAVISAAQDYVNLTNDELVSIAMDDLKEVFPGSKNVKLIQSLVIREKRATFSASNVNESLRLNAETHIKNLFLAGDWTNTRLPATIEGAVLSGFKAADRSLVFLSSQ
ncbi:MAG: oleate hydratase [Ignavibacteriales bacterium]|nr:oleate hydratase [Ignavibacteriales bacterium]